MTQLSSQISQEICQYRGEGNACLVVRLKFRKEPKVLRLVKEDVSVEKYANAGTVEKQLKDFITITKNVMQPLLGEDFVQCPFVLSLSAEEVEMINKIVKNCRPSQRCSKVVKEINTYALVFPDYCSLPQKFGSYPSVGPVISVEIKPKQGFLKSDAFCTSHKPHLCRFCMKQYYKLQKKVVSKRSSYCPLDLFSGCRKRMQYSIKSLLCTPQNNLRIFKDGELVYSEEKRNSLNYILDDFLIPGSQKISLAANFSELIVNALLKPFASTKCLSWKSSSFKLKKCTNSSSLACSSSGDECFHELPEGCILYQVLKLQMLDNLNTKDLYSLYLETKKISRNTQRIGVLPRCNLPPLVGEENKSLSESNIQFASRKVWEYLLALTLKDCSLMLTFKQLDNNHRSVAFPLDHNVVTDKNGNIYLFSIAIIDLDMKTLNKVELFFKKQHSIIESYLRAKGVH